MDTVDEPGATVNRDLSSWLSSTQQDALPVFAKGEAPTGVWVPAAASVYAETLPGAPPLAAVCALETKSCPGFVGLNSLPNWPKTPAWCANGEPGAAVRRPS